MPGAIALKLPVARYHKLQQLLKVGLIPRLPRCSSQARGEYWCLCKGADNIMGLDPQMLRGSAGYRPGVTRVWAQLISQLKRLRPLCDRPLGGSLGSSLTHYSKLGLRTLVVRLACHCSRMAVHCKSIRMSSLLIYIVNASHVASCCSRMLSFQQGCLTDLQRLLVGQAQTPDLTLLSTVAWSQIASKKLNDHEFVEDWLARWKEATVAEVRAI